MTQSLIKEARKFLPAKAPAALVNFLEAFYAKVPPDDLALITPDLMAETVRRHWEMSLKRKPGEPAVDIYTTVLDLHESGTGHTIINIVNDDRAFLVDSVAAEISRYNKLIRLLVHPVLRAATDKSGKITAITADTGDHLLGQSHM